MRAHAYRTLIAQPRLRWQAATGLLAQVTQGAAAVGIILVISRHTGSLALGGVVVGAGTVATGIARPVQGRSIDVRGSAALMTVCGLVHPAALVWIVMLAGGPRWLLVVLGVIAGLALPPVSTSMRVVWGEAVAEDQRTAAYSLVYLTQELAILTGPLILSAVIALASPSAAVIAVAAISALGTLAFAASVAASGDRRGDRGRTRGRVLGSPGVRALVAVSTLLGAVLGALEVAAPAIASARHQPAASGLLIAALSAGGILGALTYGAVRWRAEPPLRLLLLLSSTTAWLAVAVLGPSLLVLGVLLLLAGMSINPALTTISLLVDWHTPGRTAAEAFGWLSTGIAAGTGAGNAIAGVVAQHRGDARSALIVAALAGGAAVAVVAAVRRTLAAH